MMFPNVSESRKKGGSKKEKKKGGGLVRIVATTDLRVK